MPYGAQGVLGLKVWLGHLQPLGFKGWGLGFWVLGLGFKGAAVLTGILVNHNRDSVQKVKHLIKGGSSPGIELRLRLWERAGQMRAAERQVCSRHSIVNRLQQLDTSCIA